MATIVPLRWAFLRPEGVANANIFPVQMDNKDREHQGTLTRFVKLLEESLGAALQGNNVQHFDATLLNDKGLETLLTEAPNGLDHFLTSYNYVRAFGGLMGPFTEALTLLHPDNHAITERDVTIQPNYMELFIHPKPVNNCEQGVPVPQQRKWPLDDDC